MVGVIAIEKLTCLPNGDPIKMYKLSRKTIVNIAADVLSQVLDQLRRDFAEPVALERLYRLNLPVPYALCNSDGTLLEQKISEGKCADLG